MPLHTHLPLRCLELEPAGEPRGNVVLLHGLGATLEDQVGLVEELRFPARYFLFDGAFPVPGSEHYEGRAWYQRQGQELSGLDASVKKLRESLNLLKVDAAKTVVAGYSQGAAAAVSVVLASETTPAGLCMLSGYLPHPEELDAQRSRVQNLYCLLTHGIHDDVVPFKDGLNALDHLARAGARARLVALPCSHWVAVEAVVELQRFLEERLPRLQPADVAPAPGRLSGVPASA